MAGVFSFVCSDCGKTHTGSPSWSFASPIYWSDDLAQEVGGRSMLNSDLCVIRGTDFFIRCTLEIPIHDASEPVTWGVWVTQSKANFEQYRDTFYSSPERTTFGYLANRLPGYADTLSLHLAVNWQGNRARPWIRIEETDHDLHKDCVEGISWEKAIALVKPSLH